MRDDHHQPLADLYPELAYAGSLIGVLEQRAAAFDLLLDPLAPIGASSDRTTARCVRGSGSFAVYATNRDEREFRVEIARDTWGADAFASTPDLEVVARLLHAWCAGAPVEELRAAWPLLARRPLLAAPPGRVVATAWRLTLERNRNIRLGNAEIAEALYAQSALRVFFPFPSHGDFGLLSSTADPYREAVPRVTPAGDGLWNVVTPWSPETPLHTLGERLTAREAAALVAANIPDDAGPVVEGGWPDGGGHREY